MNQAIFYFLLSVPFFCFAEADPTWMSAKMLAITPEEMVFASKLNDENRRRFCHQFSSKERIEAIRKYEELALSPDSIVLEMFDLSHKEKDISSVTGSAVIQDK